MAEDYPRTGVPEDAGNLRKLGGVAHEFAHVQQEFGAGSKFLGSEFSRYFTKPLQRLSAWSTHTFGQTGALLPTYLLNPVEVHAAASGFTQLANISLLLLSRAEAYAIIHLLPEQIWGEGN